METIMPVTKLEQMFEILRSRPKKRLVAAYAVDNHTIEAVYAAVELGIIEATLVGTRSEIERVFAEENIDIAKFTIVDESDEMKATMKAVEIIRSSQYR
jgi:phosphate butyryltransferase